MSAPLRALLVDDERLARVHLRRLLDEHPEVQVVGEAGSVSEALEALGALRPDVVFLDVQMPGETGFDLLGRADDLPEVIFVTAFDQYAVRAFEVNAVDYLLKPVHPDRLRAALERLGRPPAPGDARGGRPLEYDDRILIEVGRRLQFVQVRDIVCLKAADDYSELLLRDGRRPLVLTPLKTWEARLPRQHFVRVHRSYIVQFSAVTRIDPWSNGTYLVHVDGVAEPVPMSRRHAADLKSRLR